MFDEPTVAATEGSLSVPETTAETVKLRRGDSIGRFVVIDELGRGAKGTVYAAFDAKLERQVALKLLHRSDRGIGSLLAEAQALARINHPHVVTVHDVGEHEGRLFLAMELVRGQSLRVWQRTQDRTWQEVVEVYRKAARGLAAVHAADLVHGDFKPDNVMVAEDGRVLVTDFGIARSLESTVSGDSHLASGSGSRSIEVSRIRGTPAYMAPEQFRLENVGPASDQFGYCVALHEALWGQRPFEGSTLAELATNVSENTRRPRTTKRRVPKWIDTIVDRGLSPAPADRYESMTALDDAFDASLRRRMKAFTLLGAAGLTGIVGVALGVAPAQTDPCDDAARDLQAQLASPQMQGLRERMANVEHPDAQFVSAHFERNLDSFAEAWLSTNASLCAAGEPDSEMVQARRRCLDRQQDALEAIVSVFGELPELDLARVSNLASALPEPDTCARLDDPDAPEGTDAELLIDAQQRMARARALQQTGQTKKGLALATEVLADLEPVHAPELKANTHLWRAARQRYQGDFEAALASTRAAQREAAVSRSGELPCLGWLDRTYHTQVTTPNETALVQAQLEAAELALVRAGSPAHLRIRYLMRLGSAKAHRGDHTSAAADFTEALELTKSAPPRALTVSNIYNLRAIAQISQGDKVNAHNDFKAAHDVLERAYGPHHPILSQSRSNLGAVCTELGDYACAKEAFEKAMRSVDATAAPSFPAKSHLEASLSEVAYWQRDLETSRHYAERSLATAREGGFAGLAQTVLPRHNLLRALTADEDWNAGEAVLERLLEVNDEHFAGTAEAATPLFAAAEFYLAKGDHQRALHYARRGRDVRAKHLEVGAPKQADAWRHEADILLAAAQPEEARKALEQAEALLSDGEDPPQPIRVSVAFTRVKLLRATGQPEAATAEAKALLRSIRGEDAHAQRAREELTVWMREHDIETALPSPERNSQAAPRVVPPPAVP